MATRKRNLSKRRAVTTAKNVKRVGSAIKRGAKKVGAAITAGRRNNRVGGRRRAK